MSDKLLTQILQYVVDNIGKFHAARLESLNMLNLKKVLSRKNPYLFKDKYQESAADIVKTLLDAHLSSSEGTIFGDWQEVLAILISSTVYGGKRSSAIGNDLEFDKDNVRYIVSIKSGPHWGNSSQIKSQIKKLENGFKQAMKVLRTSRHEVKVEAMNGCCFDLVFKGKLADIYKQIGNAVPVGMGYAAAKHLLWFDSLSPEEKERVQLIDPNAIYSRYRNTNHEYFEKLQKQANRRAE